MVSKKDKEILTILQEDVRTSIAEIARQVNLSENGVRYRLEKLERGRYIRNYTILLNPKKFGRHIHAMFQLEPNPETQTTFTRKLKLIDEFNQIYQVTGEYSYVAIGHFADMDALSEFINGRLVNGLDLSSFAVNVVTRSVKNEPYFI